MKKNINGLFAAVVLFFLLSSAPFVRSGESSISLPMEKNQWLHEGPFWEAALKNKTILFYFFEEQ